MTASDGRTGAVPPGTLGDILAEAKGLREDVRQAERVRRTKERLMLGLLVVGVVLLAMLALGGWVLVQVADDAKRTADRIEDCTVSTGKCYQDGSKRTGGAVREILRAQIAIEQCSKVTSNDAALERCVDEKLANAPK